MENSHLPRADSSLIGKFKLHPILFSIITLLLLSSVTLAVYFLTTAKNFEPPSKAKTVTQSDSTVTLKSDYKDPFQQKSQYINPFDLTKSPFYNLKKTK